MKAILLMGPTAAGKTDLALLLAATFPCEIISVDSAMVYRQLDIGSGKPSQAVRQQFPHHLVDILEPSETYSAGQFVRDASQLICDITARGRIPLLVGGTMLYFRSLLYGLAAMPAADPAVRAEIEQRALLQGWPALHAELNRLDPRAAARIGHNDGQRIQRALEVIALTGQPMSVVQQSASPVLPQLQCLKLALSPVDRQQLYARIETRFMQMLAAGLVAEVTALYQRAKMHRELPSMRAVGYRQLWAHLAGELTLQDATQQAILATRHLARRQLVWLRAEAALHWLDSSAVITLEHAKVQIENFLQHT